ncbi:MAG: ATP-binding protein [Deltaproteobacteria bacterium]
MNEQQRYKTRITADDGGLNGFEIFLNEVSIDPALGSETALKLRLVLEELFTNSISHARNSIVDISLEIGNDGVEVHYEDSSPPFNPLEHLPLHHLEKDIEDRPVGGLGCLLIVTMTSHMTYQRRGDKNLILFTIPGSI